MSWFIRIFHLRGLLTESKCFNMSYSMLDVHNDHFEEIGGEKIAYSDFMRKNGREFAGLALCSI